jgi:hypothetical protein
VKERILKPRGKWLMKRIVFFFVLLLSTPAFAGIESDISNLSVGEWMAIDTTYQAEVGSNLTISTVAPSWGGGCGNASDNAHGVVSKWNGGAFDTTGNRFLVFGGGHNGYCGNELYSFDFDDYQWYRIVEPSAIGDVVQNSAYYNDGLPGSRHTYNMIGYHPGWNAFIAVGGVAYWGNGGFHSAAFDIYDFDTSSWSANGTDAPSNFLFSTIEVDANTGHLWWVGTAQTRVLKEYDPSTGLWTTRSAQIQEPQFPDVAAAIDTDNKYLILAGRGIFRIYDIDSNNYDVNGFAPVISSSSSGPQTLVNHNEATLDYDSSGKQVCGWIFGSNDVYCLDTNSTPYTWVQTRTSGSAPTSTYETYNGTFGRWRYVPDKNVFVTTTNTTDYAYVFRASASNTVTVCSSGCDYTSIQSAVTAVPAGGTVQVSAETYANETVSISKNVTIEANPSLGGSGTRFKVDCNHNLVSGKGCWLITDAADDVTIDGAEIYDIAGAHNGYGIVRVENSSLTLKNSYLWDAGDHCLAVTGNYAGSTDIVVENTIFENCGWGAGGFSHAIYSGYRNSLTVKYSYFFDNRSGHAIKTRAETNYVEYNKIIDGVSGEGDLSSAIDFSCGGYSYLIGNVIQKGMDADSADLVRYMKDCDNCSGGPAPNCHTNNGFYIANNTFINDETDRGWGYIFRASTTGSWDYKTYNNIYYSADGNTLLTFSGERIPTDNGYSTGIITSDPGWTDKANYDFTLTSSATSLINQGAAPGKGKGYNLTPTKQYVDTADSEDRPSVGGLDIGAYEYNGSPPSDPPAAPTGLRIIDTVP